MRYFKSAAVFVLCLAVMTFFFGCFSAGRENADDIYDRLMLVDEFYSSNVPDLSDDPVLLQVDDSFRNIPFGSSRSYVEQTETLEVLKEYSNAIDYAHTSVLGYDMITTYWFNSSGLFYCGSYSMLSDLPFEKLKGSLLASLSGIYGQAANTNYYDTNDMIVYSDEIEAAKMVNEKKAYFYVNYNSGSIDIELKIEANDEVSGVTNYDVYVFFTDYSYDT